LYCITSLILFPIQVEFSNELHVLDWDNKRWTMLQAGTEGEIDDKSTVSRRHFHTAVLYRAGDSTSTSSSSSTKKDKKGKKDKGKGKDKGKDKVDVGEDGDASGSTKQDYMVVFGGKSNGYHNDVWLYDLSTFIIY
jgi:hypothetical protein